MTPASAADMLPDGFTVRLREDLLKVDEGAVLVGGSPARAVRLSERARGLVVGNRLTVTDRASELLARRLLDGNLADPVLDAAPLPQGQLTAVVPVRDRAAQLERCLTALAGLPVIVVDDASRDPRSVADVALRHEATLVRLEDNLGPAGARNAGLARVATQLVAFVDSDVVVKTDDLLTLARHCWDPRLALVGPQVAGEIRSARPRWYESYDALASSLDLGGKPGAVKPGAAIGWLPSACLVGRVSHLSQMSGFATELRVAEDVDLVWRLVQAGFIVRYDPTIRARHDVRATLRSWVSRKFIYGTGGAELGIRHGDRIAPAALSPLQAAGAAALLQRRWWSLPVAAIALGSSTQSLRKSLPIERGATRTAIRLSARGLAWAVRQEAALLLRHWWPLGLLAAINRPLQRPLVSAIVVDLYVFRHERGRLNLVATLSARRLDDFAYGFGLWWGAIRRRTIECLTPRKA